jgi:hypothetical protein
LRRTSNLWRALVAALITAGVLALKATAISLTTVPIAFPGITLDGAQQTSTTSSGTWQASGDELPAPWNITVSSTDFDNGAGRTIGVANFEIRLLDANIVPVTGPPSPKATSTQTSFAALSGTDLKIVTAIGAESNREYDVTPDFRLTVPAEVYIGSYTATVTITISNGP